MAPVLLRRPPMILGRSKLLLVCSLSATSLHVMACAVDEKGSEDALPEDGKLDSFRSPIDHGALRFASANAATFETDSVFHAWTFELSDSAEVSLTTEAFAPNLDTVMYLYHRDDDSDSWGSFVFKNDDHAGLLTSRIAKTLEAGQWRVLVKPFKSSMRGEFELEATCDGDGCPVTPNSCTGPTPDLLPGSGSFSKECGQRVVHLFEGGLLSGPSVTSVSFAERCEVSELERRAVDYYRSYWDDLGGWENMDPAPETDPLQITVESYALDSHKVDGKTMGGTVVAVDTDFDEDLVYFLFDTDENLLALVHDEQSPFAQFFCEGGTSAEEPDGDCMVSYIGTMMREDDAEAELELDFKADQAPGTLDPLPAAAVVDFIAQNGIAADVDMDASVIHWDSALGSRGAVVEISADGQGSATYRVGDGGFSSFEIFTIDEGDGDRFVCR